MVRIYFSGTKMSLLSKLISNKMCFRFLVVQVTLCVMIICLFQCHVKLFSIIFSAVTWCTCVAALKKDQIIWTFCAISVAESVGFIYFIIYLLDEIICYCWSSATHVWKIEHEGCCLVLYFYTHKHRLCFKWYIVLEFLKLIVVVRSGYVDFDF